MAHVQLRRKPGERVLPVFYSDNYITLVPGGSGTVTMQAALDDFHSEDALVVVDGWNVTVKPVQFAGVSIAPNLDAQPDESGKNRVFGQAGFGQYPETCSDGGTLSTSGRASECEPAGAAAPLDRQRDQSSPNP
jgi:hypothetical protein